jgi:hypothetical protein
MISGGGREVMDWFLDHDHCERRVEMRWQRDRVRRRTRRGKGGLYMRWGERDGKEGMLGGTRDDY